MSDFSHAAFVVDYGENNLKERSIAAAKQWLESEYDVQAVDFSVDTEKWEHIRGDKRDYRVETYKDKAGRPRIKAVIHSHKTNENTVFDDYGEIFEPEYRAWLEQQRNLTDAEREQFKAERAERRKQEAKERAERAERERVRAEQQRIDAEKEAALKAETLGAALKAWPHLPAATKHPYLNRKKLEGHVWHDVKQDGRELRIALHNPVTSEITGIQRITEGGEKLFVSGSHKVGSAIFLTGIPTDQVKRIFVPEGFADAGSCALALKGGQGEQHVVAAVDAGNLRPVYLELKARYPNAEIIIVSDDDAGTALKTDKKGKRLENAGQVKAHTLALEVSCKVAVPKIPGKVGANVDFSDVHALLGTTEVGRQLGAAGYAKAEFVKLETDNRSFKRGFELAQDYGCSVTVCRERYLELPELLPGVTVLRAPMGTGKTESEARWLEAHPQLSVLAVSHLRGLTADLAARLNLTDYRDIPDGFEQARAHSAYCVNSLWKLARKQQVQCVDVLFCDEIAQLLRRLTSRKDFENKRLCLDVLEFLVRSAKYVVVADAHVDATVMEWLKRLRPNDAPHMVLSTHRPGSKRTVYRHTRKGDVRAQAKGALNDGKHVYYATNGLERAKEVYGWFKTELPDLKTLLICSETAAEETVKAFFRDPNGESKKYDLIVASPSVSTGVSISNGHFSVVCGEFSTRVGTPNDALQSLSRVRGCPELHVWVEKRRANYVTERKTIRSAFLTDAGDDMGMTNIDPLTGSVGVLQGYAELYLDVKVAEHKTINVYTVDFWRLVEEDGYTIKDGEAADNAGEIEAQARSAAKDARVQALIEADDLSDREAAALRAAKTTRVLAQGEGYALERHDLKQFYRLDPEIPDDELRAVIQTDRSGDLRREVQRLELVAKSEGEIEAKMQEQREHDTLAPDMTRYDHRHKVFRATLKAVGIDPETLEATGKGYTADELRETWIKPHEAEWETYRVSVKGGLPELKYAQAQPIKALGGVLRGAFGLTHRRAGKNDAGTYTVSAAPLEARQALIDKRREKKGTDNLHYRKTKTVSSVPAPFAPVQDLPKKPVATPSPAQPISTQPVPKKVVVQNLEPDELVTISDYKGDYERLRRILNTGRLQHDRFLGSLRKSCEEAVTGNKPAQWHIDSLLKQPEVQRRLQTA